MEHAQSLSVTRYGMVLDERFAYLGEINVNRRLINPFPL